MKNRTAIILLAASLLAANTLKAQSCCSNGEWPALALNADFRAAHLPPEPFNYTPTENARMITFNTLDANKPGHAYYIPSDEPTNSILLVFHEWWGLNDYIKQEAEKWQKTLGNVDVYAVDLYDGAVATDAETAGKLSNGLDQKRGETIIKGVLAQAGNKRIATLGWCMGGTWSFTATRLAANNAAGCVMYYGFPEKDPKKVKELQTDVLYIWASQDKYITNNDVGEFKNAVEAAQHKFTWESFDAVHAFANPSNPKHDRLAAAKADKLAENFLKEKMQLK